MYIIHDLLLLFFFCCFFLFFLGGGGGGVGVLSPPRGCDILCDDIYETNWLARKSIIVYARK